MKTGFNIEIFKFIQSHPSSIYIYIAHAYSIVSQPTKPHQSIYILQTIRVFESTRKGEIRVGKMKRRRKKGRSAASIGGLLGRIDDIFYRLRKFLK
jgi:hypothetical protein